MTLKQKDKSPDNSTIFYFVLLPRLLCLCLFIPLASTLMGVLVTPVAMVRPIYFTDLYPQNVTLRENP